MNAPADLLKSPRLPARLTVEQTAAWIGCSVADVPILVRAGLLRPLGLPCAPNAVKYFATVEIEALAQDKAWLDKVTRQLYRHHQGRNHKLTGGRA